MLDGGPSDFRVYYHAAGEVLKGRSPFGAFGYIYPPLLAGMLTPLAVTDYVTARKLWAALSQVCLLAAAWLMWRILGRDRISACVVAFIWATGDSAVENIYLGQLGPQLMLLLVFAFSRTGWAQGAGLGLGFALKFLPGVAGITLLFRRDWRALAGLLAISLVLLAGPWLWVACCLSGPKAPARGDFFIGTPALYSWSLPSVVLRALDPPREGGPLPRLWAAGNDLPALQLTGFQRRISTGVVIATMALGLFVLARATRGRLVPHRQPEAMAALVALGLAASPVAWTHYQILQYPGLALLLSHAWRSRLWSLVGWTLICGAFLYPLPVAILSAYYYQRGGHWDPVAPATLYFWTSVTPMASLALFGLLVSRIRQASDQVQ